MSLIIGDKTKVKVIRTALEVNNYYDNSRKIIKLADCGEISGQIPPEYGSDSFLLPITPVCYQNFTSHRKDNATLPPPFEKCFVSEYQSPSSFKLQNGCVTVLQTSVLKFLRECVNDVEDDEVIGHVPTSWERHDDLIVLPPLSFSTSFWKSCLGSLSENQLSKFWSVVSSSLRCKRLAIDQKVSRDSFRSSSATLVLGDDGWVDHVDNGIHYVFDVTKCMFSSGNITEKLRVASFDCSGETVVDLYAGIGYFVFPYLVHAGAKVVHACEWNPMAIEALQRGLKVNRVEDRCVVHFGDNRKAGLVNIADRVNLGLIPSSEDGWPVACNALKVTTGGWLHIHGNVTTNSEVPSQDLHFGYSHLLPLKRLRCSSVVNWIGYVVEQVSNLLAKGSQAWSVQVQHVEHVKSYAPHISHIVLDLECRPQK